jgi:hypothetical protein
LNEGDWKNKLAIYGTELEETVRYHGYNLCKDLFSRHINQSNSTTFEPQVKEFSPYSRLFLVVLNKLHYGYNTYYENENGADIRAYN